MAQRSSNRVRPTVLLFDIDGTLITTGGVGRRALERAFEELFGRHDAFAFIGDVLSDHDQRDAFVINGTRNFDVAVSQRVS